MNREFEIHQTTVGKDIQYCASLLLDTDPWKKLGYDPGRCMSAFEGPCKEVWVLKIAGNIKGFAVLQVCGSFKGYIQTICIHNDFRGQGLGTILLKFCETRILEYSPNIFICVSAFNTGALKLYQGAGFKIVGVLEDFIKKGYNEILLRKTIAPLDGYTPVRIYK
jgi:[ribosomal protein S18]-alanine N-acetyltransferase